MEEDIKRLKILSGILKEHWHDKLKVSLGEAEPEQPVIQNVAQKSHWLDKLKTESHAKWYDHAVSEMIRRIKAGEFEMEVVNDLARDYASKHQASAQAFQMASDALSRKAWELGLAGANDDAKPKYDIHHNQTLTEYKIQSKTHPGERVAEKVVDWSNQLNSDPYNIIKNNLEQTRKTYFFDSVDDLVQTCKRILEKDPSLQKDFDYSHAQAVLLLWKQNKIFDLVDYVEGYAFDGVENMIKHAKQLVKSQPSDSTITENQSPNLKAAVEDLIDTWAEEDHNMTWEDTVNDVADRHNVNPKELATAYDKSMFPLKKEPKMPSSTVAREVIEKWNEYKTKFFNRENNWRWEELSNIAKAHGYWNLTEFLKLAAKIANMSAVGIKESKFNQNIKESHAREFLQVYREWLNNESESETLQETKTYTKTAGKVFEYSIKKQLSRYGADDPHLFAQMCRNKLQTQ